MTDATTPEPPAGPPLAPTLAALRGMLDAAAHMVVVVDAADSVAYVNPAGEKTLGLVPQDQVGRPVDALFREDLLALLRRVRTTYEASSTAATPLTGVAVARHRDGTDVTVEVRLSPMRVDEATWVVIGTTDVTERRREERRVRQLSQAYLTLAQLNQAIVRAPDAATLYADACRVAVEHGGYLGAWVGQRRPGTDEVEPVAQAGSLGDYIGRLRITLDPRTPQGNGPTALALREARSYFSDEFMTDRTTGPWHALASGFGIAASATVPLRRDGETVAVLTLYSAQAGLFDRSMRELLTQVAENVSYALGAFAAADRLRLVAAQRSELLRRLVTAQESERARIAADVHDDSVQALAAVDLRLGLLQRRIREEAPDLEPALVQAQETLAGATAGLRELLFDLEPPAAGVGCATALREVAEHIFEDRACSWTLECSDDLHLDGVGQAQALRILKEALINVRKHAGADHVRIAARSGAGGVEFTVADDGHGLDPDNLPRRPGHRGLETMRDRAEVTGGWWRVERPDSGGTTLRFWIPDGAGSATAPAG